MELFEEVAKKYKNKEHCIDNILQVEEVPYVDAQRNVAVTFGEKDVKLAVNAKNK